MFIRRCLVRNCPYAARALQTSAEAQSRPRRALLYMPGDDMKKICKAAQLDLDLAVLDCEDAVAVSRKSLARSTITTALNTLQFGRTERGVRTNSVSSGLIADDLAAILRNEIQPDVIMVPKLDTVEEARTLNMLVAQSSDTPVKVIFQTESAIGLLNLGSILEYLVTASHIIPVAVVFGADDYVSDIQASRDIEAVVYARQKVVAYARAYNLQPIDRVHIEFRELEALRAESKSGFGMGFAGKQCIHPTQVPIIQESFRPTPEQVEYAQQLIRSFNDSQSKGKGAFTFRDKMIDRPTLLQAQNVVNMFSDLD